MKRKSQNYLVSQDLQKGTRDQRSFRSGEIVYPWSSPIPLVMVEGNSSEMGKQFARATKSVTRKNVKFNLPLLEEVLSKSGVSVRDYVRETEAAIEKFTSSEYLDEMSSIADEVGVSYESIVLLNSNADIGSTFSSPENKDRFFCSMFSAWGGATKNNEIVAGHNDDGNRIMDQFAVLKVAKPKSGNAFACPQVPGYLGYDCLVNSMQVFVCGTAVDDKMKTTEVLRGGVPNWALYRWLGQYSKSSEDAEEKLLSTKSMTLKNWCFVSKSGGKVIESTPRHHAFMKFPSKSKDWIGLSTCTVCPEISKYTKSERRKTSGVYRLASVKREVSKRYGKITPESANEILSSHYDSKRQRNMPSEDTPCRHMEFEGKFAGTCRSLIATFRKGEQEPEDYPEAPTRIDVALGNPCSSYWRKLYFDDKFNLISGYNADDELEKKLSRMLVAM